MSLNNSLSDKILGYNISNNICYSYNNETWIEYKKNINSISIGCDGTTVLCETEPDESKKIIKSIDIYNNQTILSTINLPPNFEAFISLAVGNSNYIWGVTSTNIYNYTNNYWNNITNIGLKNGSLSGIYIGFDGSIFIISNNIVYNYVFNNLVNNRIYPVWKQIYTQNSPIVLNSMSIMTINYFWGVSIDENTNKFTKINLYTNYGDGYIKINVSTPIVDCTSVNISCCYDGNIFCICDNLLFKRGGLSASNPSGSEWIQIQRSLIDDININIIVSGPSYTYSETEYYPYFHNILSTSNLGENGPSYYMIKDLQSWIYQGLSTCVSSGNINNNIIVCLKDIIYYITNTGYMLLLSNKGLPENFVFNSISIANKENYNIIYGIVNANSIYTYKYIILTEGTWEIITSPSSNKLLYLSLGIDASVWVVDNVNIIYNYQQTKWVTIGPSTGYTSNNISAVNYTTLWGTSDNNSIDLYTYTGETSSNGEALYPSEFQKQSTIGPINNLYISYSYDKTIWCICNGLLFKNINSTSWERYTDVGNNPMITQISSNYNIYGFGSSNYFDYKSDTNNWESLGNADCISVGTYNIDNLTNNFILCNKNIIILYENNNRSNPIYLSTLGLPKDFKFFKISATNLNYICGIITSDLSVVYQYSFTDNINNGTWTSLGGPPDAKLIDISMGIDGSIYIVNLKFENIVNTIYSVYQYNDTNWNKTNIIASQISVYNSNKLIGIYNNIITLYDNSNKIIISLPQLNNYINYCYDNTVWCLSEGLIYELKGITNSTNIGTFWLPITDTINTYPITTISVTTPYSFNNNSYFVIPFKAVIASYSSINKTGALLFDQSWNIYGLYDCICFGSDQKIILCKNYDIKIVNNYGISVNLSITNLPLNNKFTSISMGDINNIYGILNNDNTFIYSYKFINNIQNGEWISIKQPEIPLISINVGFDGSLWGIDEQNYINSYSNNIWKRSEFQASNITIATSNYFWGSLKNNDGTYTLSVYTNNGSGIKQMTYLNIRSRYQVYVSVCYDGTVWYMANGYLYIINGISELYPQGQYSNQVTYKADINITYITVTPGYYYIGNVNPYYNFPYYSVGKQSIEDITKFQIPSFDNIVIESDQLICGVSLNKCLYLYNNYTAKWYFIGELKCISVGSPPYEYNKDEKTVVYSDINNFYLGTIELDNTGTIFSSIRWTNMGNIPITFTVLSMLNSKNIWAIGSDFNIYQYTDEWNMIDFKESNQAKTISVGYDGSVFLIDIDNNLYLYEELSSSWNKLDTSIKLLQISVGSIEYYWSVDINNVIYNYYNYKNYDGIIVNPPNLSVPIFSIYINVCYDGTVWALINNILFRRDGITTSNPAGIVWIMMTNIINDRTYSIAVGPGPTVVSNKGKYTYPISAPAEPMIFPYDTVIWGKNANSAFYFQTKLINQDYGTIGYYNSTSTIPTDTVLLGYVDMNYYIWNISSQNWSIGGSANCISYGCDQYTIICFNDIIKLMDNNSNIIILKTTGLPIDFTKFISISMADRNYIYGIINNNSIYRHDFSLNSWILLESPQFEDSSELLTSISVGYDKSIFATSNTSIIYYYSDSWTNTNFKASQISVASYNYYWGVYIKNIYLYINTTAEKISSPIDYDKIISINISVSYDGTVWCICNGIIFQRTGISASIPTGTNWIEIIQSINNPMIIQLISGAGSTYLIGNASIDYIWTFYGPEIPGSGQVNCIGFGCDNTVIYCDNKKSYIYKNTNTLTGWDIHSSIPDNVLLTSISVADINNIWAISSTGVIYNYLNSWIEIPGPKAKSISEGFDTTVMITDTNDDVYIYDKENWILQTGIKLSTISVGSKTYYWGVFKNSVYSINNNIRIYVPPPPLNNISKIKVSVSYDGTVWCLYGGILFIRAGISENLPNGQNWEQISKPISNTNPSLLELSANSGQSNWNIVNKSYIYPFYPIDNFVIWGILKNGDIYLYKNGIWSVMLNNQKLKITQISIGTDGSIFAITNQANNNLYFRQGITAYNLQGTYWQLIPNNVVFTYICVYNINTIYGITNVMNNDVYMCATNFTGFNLSLIKVIINNIYKIPISISLGSQGFLNIITSEGECYSIDYNFLQYTKKISKDSVKIISKNGNNTWCLVKNNNIINIIYNYTTFIYSPNTDTIIIDITCGFSEYVLVLCRDSNNVNYIYKFNGDPLDSYNWLLLYTSTNIIQINIMYPVYPVVPDKLPPAHSQPKLFDKQVYPLVATSDAQVTRAYFYKGTENYPVQPGLIQSPESLYFNTYSNLSYCYGICYSGGGSRAASMSLGISQSLFNSGFLNFNYFAYTSSNSGGGYTNFKLNYKPYKLNNSTNPSTSTTNTITRNLMLDYYYRTIQLTTSIINSEFIGNTSVGYGLTNYVPTTGLLGYWNWQQTQLIPYGLYSNAYLITPWYFVTFSPSSYSNYTLRNVKNTDMIKIISRCDKDNNGSDNGSIPIAVWGTFYSNKNNLTNQQIYPVEFSGSSSGTYRTPNSKYITEYNYKTDNIIYGSYDYGSARNGIITNPIFTKIDHGYSYPYSTNCQLLDGMYTSSAAIGTILQSSYGTIYPSLIGSYQTPVINPKTKPIENWFDPFPSYDSNSLYSADGGEIDNAGLMPLLQRKLNYIVVNLAGTDLISSTPSIPDVNYFFGTPRIQTNAAQQVNNVFALIPQFSGLYATNIKTDYQLCISVFPENELIPMWTNLYNNYINYGVPMTVFKHTFTPSLQSQIAYGFDDPYYKNYYPTIIWNILQAPQKTFVIKYDNNLTLKQNAFWKSLNIQGSSSSSIWSTYKDVVNSMNFPYYSTPTLTLTSSQVKCLSSYTSSLTDFYIVPLIQNNFKPFNLFTFNNYFIPTPYLNEDLVISNSKINYSNNISSIHGTYIPQQNKYIYGGYLTTNNYFLNYLSQNGNSTKLSSTDWTTTSLILNPSINLNISDIIVSNNGNICVCGINNNNFSKPVIYFNYTDIVDNIISYNLSTFNNTLASFDVNPCMLLSSIQVNQTQSPKNILYLGTGQTSKCVNSNLWVSIDNGISFTPVNPTTAIFNNTTLITSVYSLVQTCIQYRPKSTYAYFQYAVLTKQTTSSLNNYYLTFCTIPYFSTILSTYTINNPLINEINYNTSIIYGIEYCPTINMLILVYNTNNYISIDLYNSSILSSGNTDYQVPIQYKNVTMVNSIFVPTQLINYGIKYVGKQILLWLNNNVYALTNITYDSSSYTPKSVTFTSFLIGSDNILNIL
jgi:hypothetical protein